ncbi:uncharacterized protein LACBIDRAFT_305620 [Laccaria bicolor S238N-H82]|uniref:Predicted protein n=1 Tax=Laccaria bicolor (strain S238N-H82 / ATCC MYA-4686) TaxID=486041 RepID=B0CUN8_LACBS|nr:uncharacterized protein LACBIDRAFT_305620 [Laccaria bicolor S238N-H82]EDR14704.1 predicted protein [Laccaria bicolor S238N-H82]|eukprot:XP_001875263.1 predicted protein [Laccaria bicolor S238N-H82]
MTSPPICSSLLTRRVETHLLVYLLTKLFTYLIPCDAHHTRRGYADPHVENTVNHPNKAARKSSL